MRRLDQFASLFHSPSFQFALMLNKLHTKPFRLTEDLFCKFGVIVGHVTNGRGYRTMAPLKWM
jgi:hypothetical protein